ncbi:MAG: TIGR04283 family arsenosugar biosynthesis glycosyltransferase [Nitrospirae bacterium]|nr:TIGR04283 family arsenosugar biosynthesis glycosyltransferase [Nitrospirota bacterium]
MKISVIIPTLNEERMLPITLSKAAGLGFEELIVVDGGSHDRTREIVQAVASAPAISHQPLAISHQRSVLSPQSSALSPVSLLTAPPGRARQMNAGAAASRGDVLLFLHADTQLPLDARSAIEAALQDPSCVGGRFDVRFERDSGLGWLISRMINIRSRRTGIATGDQAMFVRRPVFERLGWFADIPIMEDVEFARRLKRAGRVASLRSQVITSFRRWESCGPLRTIVLMWTLRGLYWIGISPHTLRHKYNDER